MKRLKTYIKIETTVENGVESKKYTAMVRVLFKRKWVCYSGPARAYLNEISAHYKYMDAMEFGYEMGTVGSENRAKKIIDTIWSIENKKTEYRNYP